MPVIKSAKKKLRQDRKREEQNKGIRDSIKSLIKKAKKQKTEKSVKDAVVVIDKAVKKNVIHKNKAARFKSMLSKLSHAKPSKSEKTEVSAKGRSSSGRKKTIKKSPAKTTKKAKK